MALKEYWLNSWSDWLAMIYCSITIPERLL